MRPRGFRAAQLPSTINGIIWGILLISVVAVSGAPTATNSTKAANPTVCAQISAVTAFILAKNSSATPTVLASLTYECLRSVPNKLEPAMQLVKSLKAFVQWQSTLAFLKDPPPSYMLPPTNIEGGLDVLSVTAATGGFTSEYDFQLGIITLFATAHDSRFGYRPDVFKAVGFRNTLASDIVSVSQDGKGVPKLYHLAALKSNSTAPTITKINGQDATTFINALNLKFSIFQDPDSMWNTQFPSYARSNVTLTYDNGQEQSQESFAILRAGANFTGVQTGEDFYNRFCNPNVTQTVAATPAANTTTALPKPAPTIQGYPFPIVRDSGANTTSGYFLNGTGYDNVAVLSILAFSPAGNIGAVEYLSNFQSTVSSFLSQSKASGKTRLVVDVSANGGGFVLAGFELFAQADNLRLADSLVKISRITDSIPNNFTATTTAKNALLALSNSALVSNIIPGGVFSPEGAQFKTVDQILAPVSLKGDVFTAYQQTPLNATDPQFNLTGVGSRSNPPPAVFKPENIVILTDGTCGSTCTIFSYLMILQLNVTTTVIGGRPMSGPMQSIAGVEGVQVVPLDELSDAASAVIALSPSSEQATLKASELGVLADGYALKRLTSSAFAGSVNGKNAFGAKDSQTPLQFLYQPANCRIFYTKEMLFSPDAVWKRTVDATWTDPAANCVEGSRVAVNGSMGLDPLFQDGVKCNGRDVGWGGKNWGWG
ncbi:hypothetical protein N431DRAFT_548773 [Stipitochalara longipes BDJ]|nr:hypothetical protein N431DRAFT_548773 [Stipitochalara longipes BDJ]